MHTPYVLVNRLATPLGALLVLILMGRHSDRLLGQYALVMTFYFVMQMLPLLGLTPYVMRETARKPHEAGRYFTTIGALSLAACVVVDFGAWTYLRAVPYEAPVPEAIGIVALLIFPGILLFIAELVFMSVHRARPLALVVVVENLVRLALTAAVLVAGGELVAVMWVFFCTRSGTLAAYLVIMRRSRIVPRFERPDPVLLRETLRVLPPFLIGTVLFVVVNRLDFLVLSVYRTVQALAGYAIAYRVYDISINVLTALIMALFPLVARKFVGARAHFRVAVRNLLLAFVAGLALLCFVAVLLAPYYVLLLFPRQYPGPVPLTQLFVAALFVAGIDFAASGLLYAVDRQGADARAMAAGSALMTVLLLVLVPPYGVYGAFGAKAAASLVQAALRFRAIHAALGTLAQAGEVLRVALLVAVLAALAIALLDAPALVKVAAILATSLVLLPALMLALGLLRPLRLLRYYARPGARPASGAPTLVATIVADLRRHDRLARRGGLRRRGTPSPRVLYALLLARAADALRPGSLGARVAWRASVRLSPARAVDLVGAEEAAILAAALRGAMPHSPKAAA